MATPRATRAGAGVIVVARFVQYNDKDTRRVPAARKGDGVYFDERAAAASYAAGPLPLP